MTLHRRLLSARRHSLLAVLLPYGRLQGAPRAGVEGSREEVRSVWLLCRDEGRCMMCQQSVLTCVWRAACLRKNGRVLNRVYLHRHRLVARVGLMLNVVDIDLDVWGCGVVNGGGGRVGRRVGGGSMSVDAIRE